MHVSTAIFVPFNNLRIKLPLLDQPMSEQLISKRNQNLAHFSLIPCMYLDVTGRKKQKICAAPELKFYEIFVCGSYLAGPRNSLQNFLHAHLQTQCRRSTDCLDLRYVKNIVKTWHMDDAFSSLAHGHPIVFRIDLI